MIGSVGTARRRVSSGGVEGLFIQDDAHDLVALARAETDPQLKRALVEKLSVMDNKEAHDYMLEILNK